MVKMASTHIQTALNSFFNANKFAVVGASKDPSKFGNKVSFPSSPSDKLGLTSHSLTTSSHTLLARLGVEMVPSSFARRHADSPEGA